MHLLRPGKDFGRFDNKTKAGYTSVEATSIPDSFGHKMQRKERDWEPYWTIIEKISSFIFTGWELTEWLTCGSDKKAEYYSYHRNKRSNKDVAYGWN